MPEKVEGATSELKTTADDDIPLETSEEKQSEENSDIFILSQYMINSYREERQKIVDSQVELVDYLIGLLESPKSEFK